MSERLRRYLSSLDQLHKMFIDRDAADSERKSPTMAVDEDELEAEVEELEDELRD